MNNKNTNILLILLTLAAFVVGLIFYPQLPAQIASHWNSAGQVNGYLGKFWGIFLVPIMMVGLFLLYYFIPKIDPLKNNLSSFRKHYNVFWLLMFVFMLYIFGLQLVWNLGKHFNFTTAIIPALAGLWLVLGYIMEKTKRNWFVGIRTPWTLSSDVVWDKTHQLAGKLFKIAAVLAIFGIFLGPSAIIWLILFPVLTIVVVTILYSYIVFKKINK